MNRSVLAWLANDRELTVEASLKSSNGGDHGCD